VIDALGALKVPEIVEDQRGQDAEDREAYAAIKSEGPDGDQRTTDDLQRDAGDGGQTRQGKPA
jgi:hypothetical protein